MMAQKNDGGIVKLFKPKSLVDEDNWRNNIILRANLILSI